MNRLILITILSFPLLTFSQNNVNLRYPYRVPDWLWKDQLRSASIDSLTNALVSDKIRKMDSLYETNNDSLGDLLEKEINQLINSRLSLTDLEKGSIIINSIAGLNLSLQLDPYFNNQDKILLSKAAKIFLEIALDNKVILEAYQNSIELPTPVPEMYDSANSNLSIRKFTDEYAFMLRNRTKPFSPKQFSIQLKNALTTQTDDPALLIISTYTKNVWWGGSWYNYYNSTSTQLSKFSPSNGFFYIRLNTDSLLTNRRITFWASKIAHEVLHNLGYWHPNYKDPMERDKNNVQMHEAFIVAYELAILKKAKQFYGNK